MKRYAIAAALGASLLSSMAQAQDYQAIAQDLYQQGFENQATIRVRNDGLHVETSGSAGTTERVYSPDGTILREEETVTSDGRKIEREYDEQGSLVEEEIEEAGATRGAVVEREYTVDGALAKERISTPGGTRIDRTYDTDGNVVSNEVMRDGWDAPRGRRSDHQRSGNDEARSDDDAADGDGQRSDGDRGGRGNSEGRGSSSKSEGRGNGNGKGRG